MKRVLLWLLTALFAVTCAQAQGLPTDLSLYLIKTNGNETSAVFGSPILVETNKTVLTYVKEIDLSGVEYFQVCRDTERYGKSVSLTLDGEFVTLEKSGTKSLEVPYDAQKKVNVVIRLIKKADGTFDYQVKLAPTQRSSEPQDVYAIGAKTGWGDNDSYKMYYVGNDEFILGVTDFSGDFKFRKKGSWDWNLGNGKTSLGKNGNEVLSANGGNMAFAESFTGNFKLYKAGNDWHFSWSDPERIVFANNATYYIDSSECSWFLTGVEAGSTVIRVNDGVQDVVCELIEGTQLLKFTPSVDTENITLKRTNATNTQTWNTYTYSAPQDLTVNCLKINSDFQGLKEWYVYTPQEEQPLKVFDIYLKGVDGWTNNTPFVYDASASTEGTEHVYKIENVTIPKDKHFRFGDQNGYNDVCLSLQNKDSGGAYWLNFGEGSAALYEGKTQPMLFSYGDFKGSLTITQTASAWTLAWKEDNSQPAELKVYDFYVRGGFDNTQWNCFEKYKMIWDEEQSTESQNVYTCDIKLNNGVEFKFGAENWGDLELSLGNKGEGDVYVINSLSGSGDLVGKDNMKFSKNFDGKLTVYQTADKWIMKWSDKSELEDITEHEIYLRGLGGTWNPVERYQFTLDHINGEEAVYKWVGSIKANTNFKIGDASDKWTEVSLSRATGSTNYKITSHSAQDLPLFKNTKSGGNMYFDYDFKGTITLTQKKGEGWMWSIEASEDSFLPVRDLYLRGLLEANGKENWNAQEKYHFSFEADRDADGNLLGYIYTLDNISVKGNDPFKIGTKSEAAYGWALGLTLDNVDDEKNKQIELNGEDELLYTDSKLENMYFPRDVENLDILLYQTKDKWTMTWSSQVKEVSKDFRVYLIASDFTNWDDREKEEFSYSSKDKRFRLELNHESSHGTSRVLTNRFAIQVEKLDESGNVVDSYVRTICKDINGDGVFDERDKKDGHYVGDDVTRFGNNYMNHHISYTVGDDHKFSASDNFKNYETMTLHAGALDDVTLIYNPNTYNLTITGDDMDELKSGKFTFYYQVTYPDLTDASKSKGDSVSGKITRSITENDLKKIYFFAWGNYDIPTTSHKETTYLLASGEWPGQQISHYEEETSNRVISELKTTTNDDGETVYYYEVTVTLPPKQQAIGFVFNHDSYKENGEWKTPEQTQNFLDYEFYPGKVYTWDGVATSAPVDEMITKVYLHTTGGAVADVNDHLDMTDDNAIEYLQDVPPAAFQFETDGTSGIYKLTVDKMLIDGNLGKFVIGEVAGKTEEDADEMADDAEYGSIYSHRGAISFFHNENLNTFENLSGYDAIAPYGMNLIMPDDTVLAEKVIFTFDHATGKLYVSADMANGLVHYVIYFHNDMDYDHPHIKVYQENEDGSRTHYTANYTITDDNGNEKSLGVAMHQKGSALLSGNDHFYRHDLWVPHSVISKNDPQSIRRKAPDYENGDDEENRDDTNTPTEFTTHIITPENAATAGTPSKLHFEFTDEDGSTESKNPLYTLVNNKIENVPLVKGGVYGVSNQTSVKNETPLNKIYLVDATTGNVMMPALTQSADGSYFFKGTIKLDDGDTKFYISTDVTEGDVPGEYFPDGDTYGARDLTSAQIQNNITNALTSGSNVFNGVMVKGSVRPWVVSKSAIEAKCAAEGKPSTFPSDYEMPVQIEISPDGYYGISFGFSESDDDFQTDIDEIAEGVDDAPVMWFNLQGVRLEGPQKGLNIKVQGRNATKVYIR